MFWFDPASQFVERRNGSESFALNIEDPHFE
jgi:hypothetical protein